MSYHISLIEHLTENGCTYSLFHVSFVTLFEDFVPLAASHFIKASIVLLDIENLEEFWYCHFTKWE